MSDYRNPNDPMWQGGEYEPAGRSYGSGWGWLAGAVVIVVLIAIVFGAGHGPTRTAMNENRPPAGHMAPPPAPTPALPGLTPPPANPAQTSPAAPAQ
ncbi:MAG: hypothetical protein WA851_27315 [Xanthobacteraceae bacterium]